MNLGFVTISAADLNKSITKLIIIPITLDDRIELHVAWQFYILGPVDYEILNSISMIAFFSSNVTSITKIEYFCPCKWK